MGRAAEAAASSVDLPALGRPTRPTSAISFSLSQIVRSSPAWPWIGPARRLVHRALEAGVAEAAVAALGQAHAHAQLVEIGQQGLAVLIEHLGAGRDLQHHLVAIAAMTVAPHAVMAGPGLEVLLVAEVDQGVQALDRLDPDVAAPAAVAAVRSAIFDELLAPERHRPRPAIAGADIDLALVEKFHRGWGSVWTWLDQRHDSRHGPACPGHP